MPAIPLLHVDDDLLVVDKPAGMLVVPAPGRSGPTVVDALSRQLGQRVFAVHRLDEDTTGALVVALTDAARAGLETQFAEHLVERLYLALVRGAPTPAAGRIRSQLRAEGDLVRVVTHGGQNAITHYETLERRGRYTLLCCRLETGRRNQIRAHLQALGHPLAGDRKYGFRSDGQERFSRPMLHSWRVRFRHPITGVEVRAEAAPPDARLVPPPGAKPGEV